MPRSQQACMSIDEIFPGLIDRYLDHPGVDETAMRWLCRPDRDEDGNVILPKRRKDPKP